MPSRCRAVLAILAVLLIAATCQAPAGADLSSPSRTIPETSAPTPSAAPSASEPASTTVPEPGTLPSGPTETAVVLSITDGDTIRVDRGFGSEPVRYIGVNTPEVGDPGGADATAVNAVLVEGREVVLERDVSETDQFGRLLRYVWLLDGTTWLLVNRELVLRGVAQVATYP